MAILNDLIVRGATRCLNTLYANSLQVDSQTISGNLTVNGYTYMGYSTSRSDTKLSVAGITNNQWYRSTGSVGWYNDSYGGGIYMTDPTYVKTYNNKAFYAYNGLYTGSTQQYYLNVNGKLNAADGVFSNNLNVGNSLVSRNISATNLLRAAKYDLQTITQVGSNGTLYVAPSIQFPTSNTTSVAAASTSITIIDTNITSDVMAGVVWRPSAKVKISGTINGVVTGTVDGTITSINTSSKTMVIGNLSGGNWSSVVAGTYTKDKIENLNIMMYETYQNSTYYPVGILLTSYGSVGEHTDGTAKTFIDIYGGSATKPVVRLGSMTGLDAINGVTPSGWGLYTSNGYFSGLIVSTSGKIGGWSLSTNSLTTGTWGSSGSAMLCTGSTTQKAIGGSPASTSGWVFTAGANFGVTSSGALYANSAHISGEITATSGTIGGASITGGTLLIKDANISGKISASHIDVSSITIGSLSGADNYALKDDVPTTVAELTDSGSYLTTTVAANTYATQSNFDSLREDFDNYVAPIASKEYSNIIATANSDAKGTFYFGNIKPIDYYTPWKIKYRVQVKINGITDGYETSDIIISGAKNTYYAYQTYNSITNTSYRPYYYHILYTCTQTGISNGYGHLFGISLRYSYNPTTTSNARKINVDVVETEGCTVTLEDAPFLYANAAGTGSTNYVNIYSFDATTQGYTESGDRNETNHILNNFSGKTGAKGVWGGSLFMKDGNGKYQNICLASDGTATSASSGNGARTVATTKIVNPNGFEVGGSIYHSETSYNANTNMSNNNVYASYGAFDSRYSINSTLTANFLTPYAPIYLVGTINQTDNLFYLDSTWWTQTANNKNKVYIYIGNVYDSTTSYCRFSLAEDNTWLVYDGSKLINYQKNESDNAAKTATSYITYVNATDGIKVHNASDTTNYLQLNSSAINFYRNDIETLKIENSAIRVGKIGKNEQNVYIADGAVQIRNNKDILAKFDANKIQIGQNDSNNFKIFNRGITGSDSNGANLFMIDFYGGVASIEPVNVYYEKIEYFVSSNSSGENVTWTITLPQGMSINKTARLYFEGGKYSTSSGGYINHTTFSFSISFTPEVSKDDYYSYNTQIHYVHGEPVVDKDNKLHYVYDGDRTIEFTFKSGNYLETQDNITGYSCVLNSLLYYTNIMAPALTFGSRINDSTSQVGGYSSCFGSGNKANGYCSVAIGEGINVIDNHQIALGKYNSYTNSNLAFMLGNGTDDSSRSNAVTVNWDGDMVLSGDINTNGDANISGTITSVGDADIGGDLSVTGDINALGNINMSGLIQYNNKPMFKIVDRVFTAIGIGSGRSYTAARDIAIDGYKPMSIGGIKLTNNSSYNPSSNADASWCVIPAFWLDYSTTIDHQNVQSDSIYFYIWNMNSSKGVNVDFNVRIVYIATDALGNN